MQTNSALARNGCLAFFDQFNTLNFMSTAEIKKMSIQDRLAAMKQIWDSLCHEENEPESPAWHEEVLQKRRKLMDSPDSKYLTIEQ